MDYTIERARLGDETVLAHIQTEGWKDGFKGIIDDEVLQKYTDKNKVTEMYRNILTENFGNGYILKVKGVAHCIAWWGPSRDSDMSEYAELICIHSLRNKWRQGYGSKMLEALLRDVSTAGYSKIMLWVFEKNTRARKFYEAHGFTFNGKEKISFEAVELCYEKTLHNI